MIAVGLLAAYAWPILQPDLGPGARTGCEAAQLIAWAAFALDYVVRLSLAERRWVFVRRNLLDLAVLALPLLRPLRLLRLAVLIRVVNRSARVGLHGRVATYVVGGAVLLGAVASLAVLDAERGQRGSNISTIGDAAWWTISTMTTVGYGDHYPNTIPGRLVAVRLMVAGIALLGTVTATLATWFSGAVAEESEAVAEDLVAEVRQLRQQVGLLTEHVRALTPLPADGGAPAPSPSDLVD